MKKIGLINPNSTQEMTNSCALEAEKLLPEEFNLISLTNRTGPISIQGAKDNRIAEPGTIDLVKKNHALDGIIIGCFDDTALEKSSKLIKSPIIGLGQSSFLIASLRSGCFSVLTAMEDSVPIIEQNIYNYGLDKSCNGVYAGNIEVLALEYDTEHSTEILKSKIKKIVKLHGAQSIILGCAGMTKVSTELNRLRLAPLVDPIKASVTLMMSLIKSVT